MRAITLFLILLCFSWTSSKAQTTELFLPDAADTELTASEDSVVYRNDWGDLFYAEDSLYLIEQPDTAKVMHILDAVSKVRPQKLQLHFKPNPIRSMWLGLVFPGAGQIYNRKFWKLPIFYGGFLGCVYAFSWNSQMLRDYSQAYLDIMDSDPNTKSYEKMLPLNYKIEGREERLQRIFKNKKNLYRKWRDLSIFSFAGVYLLSVIDAYVDAELSTFDISRDLSIHLEPASLSSDTPLQRRLGQKSMGLQCNINF